MLNLVGFAFVVVLMAVQAVQRMRKMKAIVVN